MIHYSFNMDFLGSHIILLILLIFPSTLAITFHTAVTAGHIYPLVPFMSYTGDLPVESCIFSLGLNICAALYIIITVLRYNHIYYFCERNQYSDLPITTIRAYNHSSLYFGIMSSIGLSVTGSFQEILVPVVHRTGALVCSYFGFIYFWHQTLLSHIFIGTLNTARMANVRSALSVLSTLVHVVAPFLMFHIDTNYSRPHLEVLVWTEEEEGWCWHASASTMEWLVFFVNEIYTGTFYWEFKAIKLRSDKVLFL